MKRRIKRMQHGVIGIAGTGMTIGVASTALGQMPNAPVGATAAMGNMAKFLPVTGSIIGGGTALGMLSDLQKSTRRKRRR